MTYGEARILELQARVCACMARLEGLKAANAQREHCGQAAAYDEDRFLDLAREIDGHADGMRDLAEKGYVS